MPEYDEDACRRLVAVMLLEALWASRKSELERAWLQGPDAARWAALLGLSNWPPGPEALGQLEALNAGGRGRRHLRRDLEDW